MNARNRLFGLLIVCLIGVGVAAGAIGCSGSKNDDSSPPAQGGNVIAVIHTSAGDITLELYRDKMPITVDNFVRLARDGFYNGLIFHRIKDDFMIQGGGYTPDGVLKKSPYGPIKLEIHPEVQHVDGAISMARTSDPNSATSQFFICDGPQHFLDGSYAAFGVVTEGMEVVRAIASRPHDHSMGDGSGRPLEDVLILSIEIRD